MVMALSVDTALKGAYGTVDLSWQGGVLPIAIIAGLAAIQLTLLRWKVSDAADTVTAAAGPRALPLLALGAALTLELLLFQNIGQQTVLTEWKQPLALGLILFANMVALALALMALRFAARWMPWLCAGLGVLVVAILLGEHSRGMALVVLLYGQVLVSLYLVLVGVSLGRGGGEGRVTRITVAVGVGLVTGLLLLFVYYGSYELLPPELRRVVAPLAATVLAARRVPSSQPPLLVGISAQYLMMALLIIPLALWLRWDDPTPVPGGTGPVRVMSYNLHQGFNTNGRLDLEALAQVIEAEGADVVALQEVSRRWVVNGSVDTLVWMSRRLDMPYVWGPSADSIWGNAILSQWPVLEREVIPMPNNGSLNLKRNLTYARLEMRLGRDLNVIATHFTHSVGTTEERLPQAEAVLARWGGLPRTVVMGDLNAEPDTPEIQALRTAGLVDAFEGSGAVRPGYTSPSDGPYRRIDYIWVSPDLRATDFSVGDTLASDHFPISVTLKP